MHSTAELLFVAELTLPSPWMSNSVQREGDMMLVPKHWGHATLNVESGISVAIFLLDKYDSSTPQAYVRSHLEIRSNLSDVHPEVVR